MRDFFDPPIEATNIVLIDEEILRSAERRLKNCETCNPAAELPFDWLLDNLTGRKPSVTDYLLNRAANCPRCGANVLEKTLTEWNDDDGNNPKVTPAPITSAKRR